MSHPKHFFTDEEGERYHAISAGIYRDGASFAVGPSAAGREMLRLAEENASLRAEVERLKKAWEPIDAEIDAFGREIMR